MIQVVIYTNVMVSANLVDAGPWAAIFDLATNRQLILMCVSPTILAEYEEVLRRPRLKFKPPKIDNACRAFAPRADWSTQPRP
jgi:putative PIN family toxin of toxin-antitoxin system